MEERRKWLRDAGILVMVLIAIIGIASAEQEDRDDVTGEIEAVTGTEADASETDSPSSDRQEIQKTEPDMTEEFDKIMKCLDEQVVMS